MLRRPRPRPRGLSSPRVARPTNLLRPWRNKCAPRPRNIYFHTSINQFHIYPYTMDLLKKILYSIILVVILAMYFFYSQNKIATLQQENSDLQTSTQALKKTLEMQRQANSYYEKYLQKQSKHSTNSITISSNNSINSNAELLSKMFDYE